MRTFAQARPVNPAATERAEAFQRLSKAGRWRSIATRYATGDRVLTAACEIAAARWEIEKSRQAQRAAVIWGWRLP